MTTLPLPTVSELARGAMAIIREGWTHIEPGTDENDRAVPEVWSGRAKKHTLTGAIAALQSDARIDRIKLFLLGRLSVFLPRDCTFETANQSQEAALALLAKGIMDGKGEGGPGWPKAAPAGPGGGPGQGAGPLAEPGASQEARGQGGQP